MVALTDLASNHGSEASAARLKKRRAAETRLKAYGIAAIATAGLALIVLMSTVVGNALTAMTETYVALEVPLDAAEIDPEGNANPREIGRFNYDGLVKDVLKAEFPTATGRTTRRELYDIVSGGAQFELREQVMANPDLLGSTVTVPMLASDVTDLYLKGNYGLLRARDHSGELSLVPNEDGDAYQVMSSANDFNEALADVKLLLNDQAAFLRNQASLQDRGAVVFASRAEAAEDEAEKTRLIAQSEGAEAVALEGRAANPGGTEELDDKAPSVLISVGGTWLKMTEIGADSGTAVPIRGVPEAEGISAENWGYYIHDLPETARKVSDRQIAWIESLQAEGKIEQVFNMRFFSAGDSQACGSVGGDRGVVLDHVGHLFAGFPAGCDGGDLP